MVCDTPIHCFDDTGNSFACPSQSPSLSPWIIDLSATDYIFCNHSHSLFSAFTIAANLSFITATNGSQTQT